MVYLLNLRAIGGGGAGNAGALRVNTNRLNLTAGAAIAADTFLDGQGGSINVTASDRIQLSGRSILPSDSPAADPDGRLPSRITPKRQERVMPAA